MSKCNEIIPTREDCLTSVRLYYAMSRYHDSESLRVKEFKRVLEDSPFLWQEYDCNDVRIKSFPLPIIND